MTAITETPETLEPQDGLVLSESAARRINTLAEAEETPNMMLRITVSGGGCSGFQYSFAFDDKVNEDDRLFERDGAKVVVDSISLELLEGSQVDFIEDLIGSYFAINNPNASSSCGCGTSFSI
ncbi:iron-sulfur cluster insertion protein ErpA [Fodinicurvata sediminis]|uniref:iron-sulfur cluster insertion protein ErpA n=1 Tax=Fodinicurvata sediminis TaxID=1121832 RepID=UPI0003B78471|nr:iron-sulfur cluster insertion protein ErpA [Fodinicurvata sediminis]